MSRHADRNERHTQAVLDRLRPQEERLAARLTRQHMPRLRRDRKRPPLRPAGNRWLVCQHCSLPVHRSWAFVHSRLCRRNPRLGRADAARRRALVVRRTQAARQ